MVIRLMEHIMYREVPVIRIPYNLFEKDGDMQEANQPEYDLGDSSPFYWPFFGDYPARTFQKVFPGTIFRRLWTICKYYSAVMEDRRLDRQSIGEVCFC